MNTRLRTRPSEPRARRDDPDESHDAAASVRSETIRRQRDLIVAILQAHPFGLMDHEIAERMPTGRADSPSGLRTRRCELVEAGIVVDTGTRGLTPAGRWSAIWAVAAPTFEQPALFPPQGTPQ